LNVTGSSAACAKRWHESKTDPGRALRLHEAPRVEERMKIVMRIAFASVLVFVVSMIGACSSTPEWSASQRYDQHVPPSAQSVAKGTGTLTYKPPADGLLYVLDTTTQVEVEGVLKPRVIIAGYIPTGTEVIFDPKEQRIYAKGKRGGRLTNVDPTHEYELRFDPSSASSKGIAP
jgi:hypothetical protein